MSFKTHLLIVASLIAIVLIGWSYVATKDKQEAAIPKVESPYKLIIAHASWGLNCLNTKVPSGKPLENETKFLDDAVKNPLHEDNVLSKVTEMCNGKVGCSIPLSPDALGKDPMPECTNKMLEVEYRCYSFDRPWREHSNIGSLNLDCNGRNAGAAGGQ